MGRTKLMYSPLTVANAAKRLMEKGLIPFEPVWYRPVLNTPPMTDFSRKPSQAHHGRRVNTPVDIRKIYPIQRGMDVHFRRKFYKQHPWELARPKIVVEEDGADYVRWDWSKMEQIGKPLDGERYTLYGMGISDCSVVQRTLYLMREVKSSVERFEEIHGFDESQARGRPCETLPKYGNVPEINKEKEIPTRYIQITRNIIKLKVFRIILENEIKSLRETIALLKPIKQFLDVNKYNEKSLLTNSLIREKWEKVFEQPISIKLSPVYRREMSDRVKITLQETIKSVASYRERILFINRHIIQLGKKTNAMSRLTPEVAYLQACSEFYMLRQQEEVETRIAVEQAICFKRKMGLSVNEAEVQKEQIALEEWKIEAERYQRLTMDAKIKRRQNETGIIAGKEDQSDTADEEVNVEET